MATRFKIVGVEVVGLGAYLLLQLGLGLAVGKMANSDWDFGIVGTLLIIVGMEILSLVKALPTPATLGAESTDLRGT